MFLTSKLLIMQRRLLHVLMITFIIFGQACKKKEEPDPGPQLSQLTGVTLASDQLVDLTDGMGYSVADALNNTEKVDINYSKSLLLNDGTKDSLFASVLSSVDILGIDGRNPFPNVATFAPLVNASLPTTTTAEDAAQLKTLYDQAVTGFGGESKVLVNIPLGLTVMFRIRGTSSTPKYGAIQFNSFNADSTSVSTTVTVQN